MLSHTVTEIHGKDRVNAVTICKVDENKRPIESTKMTIPCDTLLLSCGLIPENELTKSAGITLDRVTGGALVNGDRETDVPGIFACGNVLHVHDLVDYVSEEAVIAGKAAVKFIKGQKSESGVDIKLFTDGKVRYTVPQRINEILDTTVYFRVADIYKDKKIVVKSADKVLLEKKKQKLAPGEMETVKLTRELLGSVQNGEINISLEDF
jgi:NADPH-dependent glutamate synthase beta subunit-like oxidoreductase